MNVGQLISKLSVLREEIEVQVDGVSADREIKSIELEDGYGEPYVVIVGDKTNMG